LKQRPYRALAVTCWNFPIYSQTFVHEELVQIAKSGFDLRLIYSHQEPRDHLQTRHALLWQVRRRLFINYRVHERHFAYYKKSMPEKIDMLLDILANASGLSRDEVSCHDNFLQAFSFTKLVESYRPHYLHSYFFYDRSLMALIAGYLLDIPRGVSCYADHLLQDYDLKVVGLHLQLCDVVVATSKRIKEELLKIGPDINPDKIIVKPNAVDSKSLPVFERMEPPQGEPYRLVCLSRIEPKKGLVYLVEAVNILIQDGWRVELHLVGTHDEGVRASEEYKQELDRLITELDLWGKVHLEGRQNQEGVIRFLQISHLFVAPFVETETGDKDGIPTALLEGMSTGLATVATDSGSIPEVIDHGQDGLIVPQCNPSALAEALEMLLKDTEKRKQMGIAAAEKVRREFDVSVCDALLHERIEAAIRDRFGCK
ncbi:MAG: glycosyltransferase family 4 protein, partial [Candidatus Electrothrix sp.]